MYVGGGRSEECVRQTVWNRDTSKPSVVFGQSLTLLAYEYCILLVIKMHISPFYIT